MNLNALLEAAASAAAGMECGSGGWIRHLLARLPRRTRDPAVAGGVTPNRIGALQDRVREDAAVSAVTEGGAVVLQGP